MDNGGGGYSGRDLLCACLLPCVLAAIVIVAVSNLATYFSVSKVLLIELQQCPFRLISEMFTRSTSNFGYARLNLMCALNIIALMLRI